MRTTYPVQNGFEITALKSKANEPITYNKDVHQDFIQIHFCIKGEGTLHFGPHYSRTVATQHSMLLYNPDQQLPIDLELSGGGEYLIFVVSIQVFHSFFSQVAGLIPFLNEENRNKKYYLEKELKPAEILVLKQLLEGDKNNAMQDLYQRGKAYEILSLYFGKSEDPSRACPFLDDEENVDKIKQAKQLVISNMSEPPTLQEIADEVGLSVSKVKEGFKHIYGESVFNFLFDYKMEYARKLLVGKQFNVAEISYQVGYSTPSHFIHAFKKKYGTTPKQYVMSLA
ncbi:MAG: AraC family transcriptional regulator [Bacteroidia bacterium]|nr:AraC family transcriptional regulator [Bacteroidia bacterium]